VPELCVQVRAAMQRHAAMAKYSADDYDVVESDIHKELLLATSKASALYLRAPDNEQHFTGK
jgi:hypothetical protein